MELDAIGFGAVACCLFRRVARRGKVEVGQGWQVARRPPGQKRIQGGGGVFVGGFGFGAEVRQINGGGAEFGKRVVAFVGFPGASIYSATKASVGAITASAAKEFGAKGITVNTVHPGPIDTEMNPGDPDVNPAAGMMAGATALGRYGTAEEIASVVAFLASPEASYVSGAQIAVDGGMTA